MKKIFVLLTIALTGFFVSSCGGNDNEDTTPQTKESIPTKTELESATSFHYYNSAESYDLYLKFKDGNIFTKEITHTGFVCNENTYPYTLNGDQISFEATSVGTTTKYSGTVSVIEITGETKKLSLKINSNGKYDARLPFWLSRNYEWSNYSF